MIIEVCTIEGAERFEDARMVYSARSQTGSEV
jgi:hypothetical protein